MPGPRTIPFDYPAPDAGAAALPGAGLPWLDTLRAEARRLSADGLPGTRMEAWKYTSLAPLAALDFPAPAAAALPGATALGAGAFDAVEGPSLVFVNGRLAPHHSSVDALPAGLRVTGLAQALADDPAQVEGLIGEAAPRNGDANGDPLAAFNAAFAADGCIVETAPGAAVDAPLRLRFVARPGGGPLAWHPRVMVRLGAGSRLTLVECHEGPAGAATWSNPFADIRIGEEAALSHVKLQTEGEARLPHGADQGGAGRWRALREPPAGARRPARPPRDPRPLRRRRGRLPARRRLYGARQPACGQHHGDRPPRARLHQPPSLQGRARR